MFRTLILLPIYCSAKFTIYCNLGMVTVSSPQVPPNREPDVTKPGTTLGMALVSGALEVVSVTVLTLHK